MMTGSITGAASILSVTQPAVTRLIQETEHMVGTPLFVRRGRRLVPTTAADSLFEEVERVFVGLDQLNHFCDRLRGDEHRPIVVSTVPSLAMSVLPDVIRDFREQRQGSAFIINTRITDVTIGWVCSRKVDFGIGSKPFAIPGVVCEQISAFNSACALPPGHPLADKPVIHARDLQGEAFITLGSAEGTRQEIDRVFEANGIQPREIAESPMVGAACAMVMAGNGIALVDQFSSSIFLNQGLTLRPFEPAVPVATYAYWLDSVAPHYDRDLLLKMIKATAAGVTHKVAASYPSAVGVNGARRRYAPALAQPSAISVPVANHTPGKV
jgi:DNA-binding transcriptional LysR family regulator